MKFVVSSIDSLIIYFGDEISDTIASQVRNATFTLKNAKLLYVKEIVPSYTSILVSYDFLQTNYKAMVKAIEKILQESKENTQTLPSRQMSIPVCYDSSLGLDLEALAKVKELSVQEIIDLHVKKEYFVYAIGFFPGFPYMGEVDARLATPRLATPRAKVPKGSVGIADKQTAVYPRLSPGGWQILGRTPIEMFDESYDGLSYLRVGDRVTFEPISKEEYISLGGEL